ncbi:MAG: GNAT family N-acetyltransferase [Granulosicoccus sp.]
MNFDIEVTSRCDQQERSAILDPLIEYNIAKAGDIDHIPLNVLLRIDDKVVGGLWGRTAYCWLCIELLYLPEQLRGQGVGRTMVAMAEAEAVSRGCQNSWLDTHEFQARGFYESIGYCCFGELPDYPPGFARYFMKKDLSRDQS